MDNNSFSKSDSPIPSTVNLHEIKPNLKHSGPGIASFVISLVSLLGYLVSFVIAATMATSILNEFGELSNDSSQAFMFLGVAVLGLAALNVIGVVTGIIGISLRNRRKVFGVIGTIINAIIILIFMLLIATVLVNIGAQ
ncbi:hypothetical protein [Paenibacillus wynnii]|uniref:hypothetical protein n=1 Tax=Paenibacillus wynnii TaxID=268407 RepID=UPI0027930307|nr:hypothetical protein [Paenibacillus wynnii]MDQ0191864.1 putative membrane protein required for colicin V production [Paenibacillus wynnii]